MKVNEYGSEHEKTVAMFQCAAEPGWVFIPSAEALAKDYHVFLFIADGHDEQGTTFVSIEKNVKDAADWLRKAGISRRAKLTGVSCCTVPCPARSAFRPSPACGRSLPIRPKAGACWAPGSWRNPCGRPAP